MNNFEKKCLTCNKMLIIINDSNSPSNSVMKMLCCCDMRLPNISQNIAESDRCTINPKILNSNSIF